MLIRTSFLCTAHHLSTRLIPPGQPIHNDTVLTADPQTRLQHRRVCILFCAGT